VLTHARDRRPAFPRRLRRGHVRRNPSVRKNGTIFSGDKDELVLNSERRGPCPAGADTFTSNRQEKEEGRRRTADRCTKKRNTPGLLPERKGRKQVPEITALRYGKRGSRIAARPAHKEEKKGRSNLLQHEATLPGRKRGKQTSLAHKSFFFHPFIRRGGLLPPPIGGKEKEAPRSSYDGK